jgi:hypothetical protein
MEHSVMVELREGVRWTSLTTTTLKIQYSMKVTEYIRTVIDPRFPELGKMSLDVGHENKKGRRSGLMSAVTGQHVKGSNFTTSTTFVVRTVTEKMESGNAKWRSEIITT